MNKIEMIAGLQIELAQIEAKDARRDRTQRRSTEASERIAKAEREHDASARELKASNAQADRGFGFSFGGAVGGIIDKGINMELAEKDGRAIANFRHAASYAGLRADLARSHASDGTETIAGRRQEVEKLIDRTLDAEERMGGIDIA
jgi:hypothetical protein